MSKEEIPIIAVSKLRMHEADSCNGCNGSEDLKRLDFRTGWNALFSIVWCKNCRAIVAEYLKGLKDEQARDEQARLEATVTQLRAELEQAQKQLYSFYARKNSKPSGK